MTGAGQWWKVCALCCVLAAIGCSDSKDQAGGLTYGLRGRAFGSDTGQPLTDATVRVGNSTAASDGKGAFVVSYSADTKSKNVEVTAEKYAPVQKSVPDGDGYVEVFAKSIDVTQTLEPSKGGAVKSKNGAGFSVKAGSLETKNKQAPAAVQLTMAVPDTAKSTDLDALPGNFMAKSGEKTGKLSAASPVYINASEKGQNLKLKGDQTASVTLPAHGKKKAAQFVLYRYDETLGLWVEVGPATAGVDADGMSVYFAEVDGFGWFTVGTFIEELTCIRACAVHEDQTPVPFARALATGVDLFTQSAGFAGADGCVALDVPVNARLTLSLHAEGARAAPQLVQSATGGSASAPETCLALPPVVLSATETNACPLGFAQCDGICVDIGRDSAHCGGCNQGCGENLCAGARCVDFEPPSPMPKPDAGVEPGRDASTAPPDAGPVCVPVVEDCFNGVDDDCDTQTDCEDPECAGPAVCGAEGAALGFLQPAGSTCPAGTVADVQPLRQNPQTGTCSGCSCGAVSATTCSATVSGWTDNCNGTAATMVQPVINSYTCNGASSQASYDTMRGFYAVFTATSGSCPPSGNPKPSALSWGNNAVFCRIMRTGKGCATGQLCLPRNDVQPTAPVCNQITSGTCAATQTTQTWYTGADDGRSCTACKCNATGASCANVKVQFGNDYSCTGTGTTPSPLLVGDKQQVCNAYAYGPQAMLVGTPTPATCSAATNVQGSILPLGTTTLCCGP